MEPKRGAIWNFSHKELIVDNLIIQPLVQFLEINYKTKFDIKNIYEETTQRGKPCFRVYTNDKCCYKQLIFTVSELGRTISNCSCGYFKRLKIPVDIWKELISTQRSEIKNNILNVTNTESYQRELINNKFTIQILTWLLKEVYETDFYINTVYKEMVQNGKMGFHIYTENLCCDIPLVLIITEQGYIFSNCNCSKFEKMKIPAYIWKIIVSLLSYQKEKTQTDSMDFETIHFDE